jgi:TatD DNase family protein
MRACVAPTASSSSRTDHRYPVSTWIDHHCHLPRDGTHDAVIDAAVAAGVVALIDVATDVPSARAAIELARARPEVWATAGVHPHDASSGTSGVEELLARPEVVAVGECGLDYHYMHSPVEAQKSVFADQVALATQHDLALVIHTRNAWDDTFDILAAVGVPERTVFHCFTGGPEEARRCIDLGASVSFSGIVTFPSAPELREAAAWCPLDKILVETDSPYLAPVPHRGRPNSPEWVVVVGEAVAAVRGIPADELADRTTANTQALYRLPNHEATP